MLNISNFQHDQPNLGHVLTPGLCWTDTGGGEGPREQNFLAQFLAG